MSRRVDGEPHPVTIGLDLVNRGGETLHTHVRRARRPEPAPAARHRRVLRRRVPRHGGVGRHPARREDRRPAHAAPRRRYAGPGRGGPRAGRPLDAVRRPRLRDGPAPVDGAGPAHRGGPQRRSPTWSRCPRPGCPPGHRRWCRGRCPPTSTPDGSPASAWTVRTSAAVRVGELSRVPASRPGTVVMNLDAVARGRAVSGGATTQLWFADDDPRFLARTTAALADHGVVVSAVSTLTDTRRGYDESTPAWSLGLAVVVGVAALLIALLVLVVSAVSTWRFRVRDLAALRMSGIPGSAIRTMAVAGQLPGVLLGVVAGTLSGLAGAHLALPIVPLFASAPEVSTLDLGTAWGVVAGAALGVAAVLGLGRGPRRGDPRPALRRRPAAGDAVTAPRSGHAGQHPPAGAHLPHRGARGGGAVRRRPRRRARRDGGAARPVRGRQVHAAQPAGGRLPGQRRQGARRRPRALVGLRAGSWTRCARARCR